MGTGQYALDKPMAAIGQGLLGFSDALNQARDYRLRKEQVDSEVAQRNLQGQLLQRQIDQAGQLVGVVKNEPGAPLTPDSGQTGGVLSQSAAPTGGILSGGPSMNVADPVATPKDQSTSDLIDYYSKYYGVDPAFTTSLIANGEQNKNFDPNSVSPKGATGIMQIMPATAQGLGVDPSQLKDPATNIMAGTKLISQLAAKYPNDPRMVAAAYNAGSGAVDSAGGVPNIPETTAYVQRMFQPQGGTQLAQNGTQPGQPAMATDASGQSTTTPATASGQADPVVQAIQAKMDYWGPRTAAIGLVGEAAKARMSALDMQLKAHMAQTPAQAAQTEVQKSGQIAQQGKNIENQSTPTGYFGPMDGSQSPKPFMPGQTVPVGWAQVDKNTGLPTAGQSPQELAANTSIMKDQDAAVATLNSNVTGQQRLAHMAEVATAGGRWAEPSIFIANLLDAMGADGTGMLGQLKNSLAPQAENAAMLEKLTSRQLLDTLSAKPGMARAARTMMPFIQSANPNHELDAEMTLPIIQAVNNEVNLSNGSIQKTLGMKTGTALDARNQGQLDYWNPQIEDAGKRIESSIAAYKSDKGVGAPPEGTIIRDKTTGMTGRVQNGQPVWDK